MVAAIKASGHARDFAETVLAEPFFRAVVSQSLTLSAPGSATNRAPFSDAPSFTD